MFSCLISLLNVFTFSQVLNLSYNYLSADDVASLGRLPRLKVLHLTGNQLRRLPPDLGSPSCDAAPRLMLHLVLHEEACLV